MTASHTDQWTTLEITVPHELADAVNDFCIDQGSGGVVIDDSDARVVRVTAYFPSHRRQAVESRLRELLAALAETFPDLPAAELVVSQLPHQDWATAWQSRFRPIEVGKHLMVTPPWIEPRSEHRTPIVIEPAEAFGTGTHETTQGCLELLEEAAEELTRTGTRFSVLDLGCGSGILAIAAKKLGAFRVTGVDNDPAAIRSARRNAALNNLEIDLDLRNQTLTECSEPTDLVVANLDPLTLLANRKLIAALFTRFLILSGVPLDQWDQVKEMYRSDRSALRREITRSEWGCGLFEKVK
ncbi:MAG: 50S ribosomal protein L11 methyltransferase [Desulfomonilaceae bacterium]|nr:50S ribosomal protein L11 methyltransferase [Desulfomonilaceae bacterium]